MESGVESRLKVKRQSITEQLRAILLLPSDKEIFWRAAESVGAPAPLDHLRNETRPAGLVACTETFARISVKIFMEQDKVSEVRV